MAYEAAAYVSLRDYNPSEKFHIGYEPSCTPVHRECWEDKEEAIRKIVKSEVQEAFADLKHFLRKCCGRSTRCKDTSTGKLEAMCAILQGFIDSQQAKEDISILDELMDSNEVIEKLKISESTLKRHKRQLDPMRFGTKDYYLRSCKMFKAVYEINTLSLSKGWQRAIEDIR